MFKINNLTFSYEKCSDPILDRLNLELPLGTCVGLLGNNGSGKTTLAYCLLGVIPELYGGQLNGEFIRDDENLFAKSLAQRSSFIAYTFQDYESQLLFGTVADVMGLHENATHKELVKLAIDLFEIGHLLQRPIEHLSAGESHRVILASSIRNDPQLLIYDEVTASLDPIVKLKLKDFIRSLLADGRAVISLSQRPENLFDISSCNYRLRDAKITINGSAPVIPHTRSLRSFWDNLDIAPEKPVDLRISMRYRRKGGGFEIALNDFHVPPGSNVAFIGENGSGKSTLLSLLGGFLKPSFFKCNMPDLAHSTRLVFHSPAVQIINSTVGAELDPDGLFDEQQRALITSFFPFLEFSRDPLDLSFGQQRMLVMLAALLSTRPLVLIDEPELGLDGENLAFIWSYLERNRWKRAKSILFATHDMELAARLADLCFLVDRDSLVPCKPGSNARELEEYIFKGHYERP